MMNVVLDTSIYRRHSSRQSASFKAFERLAENSLIQLHVPHIIEHENFSQLHEDYISEFNSLLKAAKNLQRKTMLVDPENEIDQCIMRIPSVKDKTLRHIEEEFQEWLNRVGAKKHAIESDHALRVFESYFRGGPPFSSKKARKDIPDAFIFECIRDLHRQYNNVQVVAGDANLRKALEDQLRILTFSSLEDFVDSELCQELLKEQRIGDHFSEIKDNIALHSNLLRQIIDSQYEKCLQDEIVKDSYIPDDNNEATIQGVYEPEDLEFDFDDIRYFGEGLLGIPFSFRTEALTYYYLFKMDLYGLNDERTNNLSLSDHNKHYYEVEEHFTLVVSAILTLNIDVDKLGDVEALEEIIDYDSSEIDSITSIELEHSGGIE